MKQLCAMLLILALLCGCAMAEAIGTRMQIVNCEEWVSLREDPAKTADRLKKIPLGADSVTMLDWNCGDFAEVSYGGKRGYVLKEYLRAVQRYEGEALSLSDKQRFNVNIFLSNFSEQYFAVTEGCYDENSSDPSMAVDFAVNHIWFNKHDLLEWGEWGEYDGAWYANVRLDASRVPATVKKYLGKAVADPSSRWYDLIDGYYYWQETGGHSNDGFVCYDSVHAIDADRLGVYFHVYGPWDDYFENTAVCYRTPEEIQKDYWCYLQGHAVIYTGGNLSDRGGWHLERYTVNYAE